MWRIGFIGFSFPAFQQRSGRAPAGVGRPSRVASVKLVWQAVRSNAACAPTIAARWIARRRALCRLEGMTDWLGPLLALSLTGAVTLGVGVWLVRLPSDAFRRSGEDTSAKLPQRILRGALGVLLILAGAVLALPGVPGPGVALVVLGLIIADLPGKQRALRHLLRLPRTTFAVNRLRRAFHRAPLEPPS
jgi:hypothetical protein